MIQNCKHCNTEFVKTPRRKYFCCHHCAVISHNKSESQKSIIRKRIGEKNQAWLGENAKYSAKHVWIRSVYGSANKCERCHTDEKTKFEWANLSGKYLRDRSDFMSLCLKCHRSFDLGKRVNQYTILGKFVRTFFSYAEAARFVGVSKNTIINAASARRKTSAGYSWRQVEITN